MDKICNGQVIQRVAKNCNGQVINRIVILYIGQVIHSIAKHFIGQIIDIKIYLIPKTPPMLMCSVFPKIHKYVKWNHQVICIGTNDQIKNNNIALSNFL